MTVEKYLEDNLHDMLSGNFDCDKDIEDRVQYVKDGEWVEVVY